MRVVIQRRDIDTNDARIAVLSKQVLLPRTQLPLLSPIMSTAF